MTRAITVFKDAASRPMEAIETIIALVLFVFGCYLISPLYIEAPQTASSALASNPTALLIAGVGLYILPALPILLGLFWKRVNTLKWRTRSTFWMFIACMFITLLRLITIGFTPLVWLFTFALGLIAAVCFLYMRVRHARV